MFSLARKDLIFWLINWGLYLGYPWIPYLTDGMDRGLAIMLGLFMLLTVLASVNGAESVEGKDRGYDFLKTLPIRDTELVAGKFFLPLVFVILDVIYAVLFLHIHSPSVEFFVIGRGFVFLCAAISLVAAGGVYVAVFRFGITRFMRGVLILVPVLLMIVPFVTWLFVRESLSAMDIQIFVNMAAPRNIVKVMAVGLVLYSLSMRLAVKTKRAAYS